MAMQPRARNPRGVIDRANCLSSRPRRCATGSRRRRRRRRSSVFALLDRLLRVVEPFFPGEPRRRAIDKAVGFVTERLNGEDGLGGIFPAMANSVMMFDCLGYPPDHPRLRDRRSARSASCSSATASSVYCQPCLSPVWDTALACHALMEVGDDGSRRALAPRARLARRQAGARRRRRLGRDAAGAAAGRLGLPVRQPALSRSRRHRRGWPGARPLRRGALPARRSTAPPNGSSACRAATAAGAPSMPTTRIIYLNHIPFADHGALLDPPTADVSGALPRLSGAARLCRRPSGGGRGARLSAARAGGGRQLVRPLGHQLHLWHLVGAGRAQRRRHRPGRAGNAPRRRLAARAPARRRRLGRDAARAIGRTRRTAKRPTAPRRRPPGRCSA